VKKALKAAHAEAVLSPEDERYAWQVLGVVMIGTLMSALDTSIVNVSLPAIMADFGSSLDEIEWVVTAYMLAFATLMPLTSWVRDRWGHRSLYSAALIIFTVGSVLCGLAWSLPVLIFARVLQALGGGALTPVGMAMISEVFPPKERGKALGYWGMGVIIGPAFGPTLGGWLTKVFGWRSIFMINLPIGIIGVIMSLRILRHDKPHESTHKPFDVWGFAFLSVFLVAFLLGLSKGEHEGWTSTYILSCFWVSGLSLVGFFLVESLTTHGIVDLGLFRDPIFSASMVVTVVRSVALFGGSFLLPVFLQQLRGLDEVQTGLILLPGSLAIGAMMPATAKLTDKFGPRLMTAVGLVGVAAFMYMYRDIDVNTSSWDIIFPTIIRGVGIALLFTPVMTTALNSTPRPKVGMASAMLNLASQIGGSMGIAVLAMVLDHRVKFHMAVLGGEVDRGSGAVGEAVRRMAAHAMEIGYTHAESFRIAFMGVGRSVGSSAAVGGFQDAFLFGTLIVLSGILSALFLPGHAVHAPSAGAEPVHME
jgi:DHA2 family multidrug resistance protein